MVLQDLESSQVSIKARVTEQFIRIISIYTDTQNYFIPMSNILLRSLSRDQYNVSPLNNICKPISSGTLTPGSQNILTSQRCCDIEANFDDFPPPRRVSRSPSTRS